MCRTVRLRRNLELRIASAHASITILKTRLLENLHLMDDDQVYKMDFKIMMIQEKVEKMLIELRELNQ